MFGHLAQEPPFASRISARKDLWFDVDWPVGCCPVSRSRPHLDILNDQFRHKCRPNFRKCLYKLSDGDGRRATQPKTSIRERDPVEGRPKCSHPCSLLSNRHRERNNQGTSVLAAKKAYYASDNRMEWVVTDHEVVRSFQSFSAELNAAGDEPTSIAKRFDETQSNKPHRRCLTNQTNLELFRYRLSCNSKIDHFGRTFPIGNDQAYSRPPLHRLQRFHRRHGALFFVKTIRRRYQRVMDFAILRFDYAHAKRNRPISASAPFATRLAVVSVPTCLLPDRFRP